MILYSFPDSELKKAAFRQMFQAGNVKTGIYPSRGKKFFSR